MAYIKPLIVLAVVVGAAPAAQAQDETFIPDLKFGDDVTWVEFYGQIDKGLLVYNDGLQTLTYFPVDNANSSTRAGLRGMVDLGDGRSFGANFEAEWTPYSTNHVNQNNIGVIDWDAALLRKAEVYYTDPDMGKFWLGQGSMASDATAESDLSGTTVIGYSAIADLAGGQLLRFAGGGPLSAISIGGAFKNLDGTGRKLRIRYDTPSYEGFTFGASVGTQVVPTYSGVGVWDVAAKYAGEMGDVQIAAAAALSQPGMDQFQLDGSFSALHVPSGFSLTVAGGFLNQSSGNGQYIYGKAGYQASLNDLGLTAVSVDAYYGTGLTSNDGSTSASVGAQLVQTIDYLQTDLYLGFRHYVYDDIIANYDPGDAILGGARVRF